MEQANSLLFHQMSVLSAFLSAGKHVQSNPDSNNQNCMRSCKLRHKVMQTKAQIEYFHCVFLGVPRFWASLSLLVLACACRHNLICSLWAKGQLQIQGAIDESTWIKAETLNGKGSKNEPSVGLNSAYIMLHLSCRATEWIRRKGLCRPRQRRCIRKVPATERFDGSGNPSPTHQKNARTGHWLFISNGFTLEFKSVKIWKSTPVAKRMQQHAQQGETIKASLLAYLHPGSDDTWFHVRRRVKCCGPNCFTSPMFDGCDQTNTKSVLYLHICRKIYTYVVEKNVSI